jgi:dsRNA-specific ribonuclease
MSNDGLQRRPRPAEMEELLALAWLGDSVLELFVRQWVLKEHGRRDIQSKVNLTSNAFLNALGHPTRVEAHIGRLYQEQGIQAAWAWIEEKVMPLYAKQEANRRPGSAR